MTTLSISRKQLETLVSTGTVDTKVKNRLVTILVTDQTKEVRAKEYPAYPVPSYVVVKTVEALRRMLDLIEGTVAIDIETTGLNPRQDRIRTVQLATGDKTFVVLADSLDVRLLEPLFSGKYHLVFHNAKFDLSFFYTLGIILPSGEMLFDTQLAAQLLEAGSLWGTIKETSLSRCTERYLGYELSKEERGEGWAGALTREQLDYAAKDARVTLELSEKLRQLLTEHKLKQVSNIEFRCIPVFVWMEAHGIPLTGEQWKREADRSSMEAATLLHELDALAGRQINWDSPKQVAEYFNGKGHREEDGTLLKSTAEKVLARLALTDAVAELLLRYRKAAKLAGTYGAKWVEEHVDKQTSKVYTNFHQLGTDTGRVSCSHPNMQQVPRDGGYRACVVAPPGYSLLIADYSQLQLRIAAVMAPDMGMLEAYKEGRDVHRLTASQVLGVPMDEVTSEQRRIAKSVNFGLIFGMSAPKFQEFAFSEYGVLMTLTEARRYRKAYFRTYTGIKAWHDRQTDGQIETRTLANRLRKGIEKFTDKCNTPVQGTEADGMKLAMARLYESRTSVGSFQLILMVHDELVAMVRDDEVEEGKKFLTETMISAMERVVRGGVPIEVECRVKPCWAK